jgi:hypothetical protein
MTTAELQAIPRSITGTIKSVDSDNKAWLEQTKPKLEHPVGYFIRGPELVDLLKSLEGQTVNLIIGPDRIKKDRADDGNFASYWWSIRSEETSGDGTPVQAPPKPDDPAPTPTPKDQPSNNQPYEIPPNPAALGACHNHAVDFIVRGILPIPEGRELFGWVRELRDRFYREINQAPVMPLHYCYEHDQERRQSKTGNWGHILPKEAEDEADSYCIENREGWRVFDASQR